MSDEYNFMKFLRFSSECFQRPGYNTSWKSCVQTKNEDCCTFIWHNSIFWQLVYQELYRCYDATKTNAGGQEEW